MCRNKNSKTKTKLVRYGKKERILYGYCDIITQFFYSMSDVKTKPYADVIFMFPVPVCYYSIRHPILLLPYPLLLFALSRPVGIFISLIRIDYTQKPL